MTGCTSEIRCPGKAPRAAPGAETKEDSRGERGPWECRRHGWFPGRGQPAGGGHDSNSSGAQPAQVLKGAEKTSRGRLSQKWGLREKAAIHSLMYIFIQTTLSTRIHQALCLCREYDSFYAHRAGKRGLWAPVHLGEPRLTPMGLAYQYFPLCYYKIFPNLENKFRESSSWTN